MLHKYNHNGTMVTTNGKENIMAIIIIAALLIIGINEVLIIKTCNEIIEQ